MASAVVVALKGQDAWGREQAAWVLGYMNAPAETAVPTLIAATKDPSPRVRRAAVNILSKFCLLGPGVPAAFADALSDKDDEVGVVALNSLCAMRSHAAPAMLTFVGMVRSSDNVRRWEVVRILESIGGLSAPSLVAALKDPAAEVRACAADALGNTSIAAVTGVPGLTTLLKDPNRGVATTAADSLGAIAEQVRIGKARICQDELRTTIAPELMQAAVGIRSMPEATKPVMRADAMTVEIATQSISTYLSLLPSKFIHTRGRP